MKLDNFLINDIKARADIRRCIPGADEMKTTSYVRCPECGKEGKGKGLCVTHKGDTNIAKCFACGFSLANAVAAVMYYDFGAINYIGKEQGETAGNYYLGRSSSAVSYAGTTSPYYTTVLPTTVGSIGLD